FQLCVRKEQPRGHVDKSGRAMTFHLIFHLRRALPVVVTVHSTKRLPPSPRRDVTRRFLRPASRLPYSRRPACPRAQPNLPRRTNLRRRERRDEGGPSRLLAPQ